MATTTINPMGENHQGIGSMDLIEKTLTHSGILQYQRDDSSGVISFSIAGRYPAGIKMDILNHHLVIFCRTGIFLMVDSDCDDPGQKFRLEKILSTQTVGRLFYRLILTEDGRIEVIICGMLPIRRNLDSQLKHCFFDLNRMLLQLNTVL